VDKYKAALIYLRLNGKQQRGIEGKDCRGRKQGEVLEYLPDSR